MHALLILCLSWAPQVAEPAKGAAPARSAAVAPGPAPAAVPPKPRSLGPSYDPNTGWPLPPPSAVDVADVPVQPPPAMPAGERSLSSATPSPTAPAVPSTVRPRNSDGSPLVAVFATVGTTAAFLQCGGVVVRWRLRVLGPAGEEVGSRELVHHADFAHGDRDRIEFEDGRIYLRSGGVVAAFRHGTPWPTLVESAADELALFGLHLRLPWAFVDPNAYAIVGQQPGGPGSGANVRRILLQRIVRGAGDRIGPELESPATDRFELWVDAGSGLPTQFGHTLQGSRESRRVLLDDYRDVDGIKLPFRRTYVDAAGRPTTVLELLRCDVRQAVGERSFKLP